MATHNTWFGGVYQDPSNFFAQIAVEPEPFMTLYPEYRLPPEQMKAWLADRQGVVVGVDLAKRFNWKIGDRDSDPRHHLAAEAGPGLGVQHRRDLRRRTRRRQDPVLLPLRLPRREPPSGRGRWSAGTSSRSRTRRRRSRWARSSTRCSPTPSAETKTTTEKGFVEGFAKQVGDIGAIMIAILAAVLFTMMLVAANTMAQSVRERTSEVGVLKTLGFSNASILMLVLGEAVLIAVIGGGLGLLVSWLFVQQGDPTGGMLPIFTLPPRDVAIGAALIVGLGLVAACGRRSTPCS